MAYNRNYNSYSRSNGGYSRQYQQQPRKRSGAKFTKVQGNDGIIPIVSAWRVNRRGELLVLYARPYKSTATHEGKRGIFYNYFVTITNKSNYNVTRTSGLLYPDDRRLLIPDFGEIVTANGKGGTWCSAVRRR